MESINYALRGIVQALQSQRNMKIHFLTSVLVLILATVLNVSRIELIALFLVVAMVITAELQHVD